MAGLGLVKKPKTEVTLEELKRKFPNKAKTIDEDTVELINAANNDPYFNGDEFISTMHDYESVMYKNSASLKAYITALKFCAYLEAEGDNYIEAYKKSRPNDEFVIVRKDASTDSDAYRELAYAASRYRKTPLVRDILIQADMPLYLMFQGARYKAVKLLADEMLGAQYSKDRISAADKLLTHVKPPENVQIELGVTTKDSSAVQSLNAQLAEFAMNTKKHLEAGSVSVNELGAMKAKDDEDIIDVESEEFKL